MTKKKKDFFKALLSLIFWLVVAYLVVTKPIHGFTIAIIGLLLFIWNKIKNKPIIKFTKK